MGFYTRLFCCMAILTLLSTSSSYGQYAIWAFRAGPSLGFQKWNGLSSNQPLLGYHGAVAYESYTPGSPFAFFGELGYHQRGSSRRIPATQTPDGINLDGYTLRNVFHNVALALGGRQSFGERDMFYYLLAVRLEYTMKQKMDAYSGFDEFVRKLNYGLDVGGGFNFPVGGFHMGFVQVQLQPDASKQILSPRFQGYDYQNNPIIYQEQKVVNYSLELSVGIRINGNLAVD